MSTMPERPDFADVAAPRLLVAIPQAAQNGRSRGRWLALGAILAGVAIAVVVAVVALVGGSGSSGPSRGHGVAATAKVVLPVVVGAHAQLAESLLQGEGFSVQVHTVSGGGSAGMVVGEKPAGGRAVPKSTRVLLTVSNG
jgi:hypothetical protein